MSIAKYYFLFLLSFSQLVADSSDVASTLSEKIRKNVSCPVSIFKAQQQGDYKAAILELQSLISKKPTSELYLSLAVCQLQDQQEEEAFKTYMLCLEKAKSQQNKTVSSSEKTTYDELLALYIANSPDLDTKLATTLKDHPDYTQCQFFLASSMANSRKFEPFFYLFYQSYCSFPDCHMSHKTQGVIASLILQRAKSLQEKDLWRKQALGSLGLALKQCPQDTGLHKMLIYTASDKERKQVVQMVIQEVIAKDVQIARGEIPFYINHALWVEEPGLAQQLLDKAKTWYQYSRIIQEMQDLIDQNKAKEIHG